MSLSRITGEMDGAARPAGCSSEGCTSHLSPVTPVRGEQESWWREAPSENDYRRNIPMHVGTLLGIVAGLAAPADVPSPGAPLRTLDQAPALSATSSRTQQTLLFSMGLWVSCANGGLGEYVNLSGELQIHSQSVEDAKGGTHLTTHVRPSGVVGIGVTSGLRYLGVGGTFEGVGYAAAGEATVYTFVNNFRIIGKGPDNNLLVHYTVHQTLNANGEVTADVDLSITDCQ
jgi:hypothetical protein